MIDANVRLGKNVKIEHPHLVNLYGCVIGDGVIIGPFVEIQRYSFIGSNSKISSHSFICGGVLIEEDVMVGHGVMFTNDVCPTRDPAPLAPATADWDFRPTRVQRGAVIGSHATIMAGVTIGAGACVAPGAVVTHDVPAHVSVAGVPAQLVSVHADADDLDVA